MSYAEIGSPEQQERRFPTIDDQYRAIVRTILTEGERKGDPQGVGNLSCHGLTLEYDLSKGEIPILGLRDLRGARKAMAEELFWIMSGSTNVHDLNKVGVHIWDQWAEATQDWVRQGKLPPYPEGELGPVYGKQWRALEAGDGQTYDQLAEVMRLLRTNPDSRRTAISVWNPADNEKVFIAPCIRYLQFHHAQGKLGLTIVQGSADVAIGVPFDTTEYALFLMMVARINGMQPAKFQHVLVDAHIYENQIPHMEELLQRAPTPPATLTIDAMPQDVFGFKREDFKLSGYLPHPKMDIPVAL